ncbi:hypothetical protein [Actinomadura sp. 21ATH]|uniref:hypothetical protein n=1 Tax=Actinomadura sp. 21ATH TaxID=1735444 RepID=UPI0035C1C74E
MSPGPAAAHAAAPDPPGRADLLARRLARDPIQITDHAPREIPADAAARIRAHLARLNVPAYVVVGPGPLPISTIPDRDTLIPLLHDRLRKDGLYIVTDHRGSGEARQYGGSLPAGRAWLTARLELPYDAGVVAHVERFVEILTAPDVAKRIEQRRSRPPAPPYRDRSAERDRKEMLAMAGGTAAGALAAAAALAVWRRKARR